MNSSGHFNSVTLHLQFLLQNFALGGCARQLKGSFVWCGPKSVDLSVGAPVTFKLAVKLPSETCLLPCRAHSGWVRITGVGCRSGDRQVRQTLTVMDSSVSPRGCPVNRLGALGFLHSSSLGQHSAPRQPDVCQSKLGLRRRGLPPVISARIKMSSEQ